MAYNGGFDQPPPQQGRPYGGPAGPGGQRPPPQRQYPPGPGGPQAYNGPPQQYEQYQDEYGYGYDEYGNGYDQGYGEQYDGQNYNQRGYPPSQNYPPQQEFYGRGNVRGRGGPPMARGRGGPMRPPPGDGGRGGPYPPRGGGMPSGAGRGYPPNRGGRPGPPERAGHSDPSADRRPPNGPLSPPGFGDSPFPTFPGTHRKTSLDEANQISAKMGGMDIGGGRPAPRHQGSQDSYRGRPSVDGYGGRGPGPMGPPGPARQPPQQYPPQDYPDQRRGPPPGPDYGPPMGGFHDDGYGPPGRSMTMPAGEHADMQRAPLPHRSESAPFNGRGMPPPRPSTAQAMRPPVQVQRSLPPNTGPEFGEPMYDQQTGPVYGAPLQQRPASYDDYYNDYYDQQQGGGYPARDPPSAVSDMPDFDAMPSTKPRNSLDQHMQPGTQEQTQRGPGRMPEMSRTKSQPDLRNSQTAVFEMAGDAPPMPMAMPIGPPMPGQYQQGPPPQPGYQGGLPPSQRGFQQSPAPGPQGPQGMGLPSGPAPYRPGVQPPPSQGAPTFNPDSLPSHPTPVRPGLMPNSLVSLGNKPPPVRNYGGAPVGPVPAGPPPPQNSGTPAPAPAPAKPVEAPVTVQELEHLRAVVKSDSNDQVSALQLAKKLVEAADVLVPNLPDPKARQRSRDRYLLDAQKILKKLANASNPDAMFFLADCCGRSLFSAEPDNKEAFTLYQSAAKLGHAAAAYRTAVCCEIGHEEGGGTRKDPLKAIQWYKRAATLGDTPAMYKVGMILLKGLLGQPRNPREAVSWLKRAAERADSENPHALHELGLLYESAQPNDAILRDDAYAFSLFKQAADLGYKFSQFRLGCAYEYGLMGCPIDPRLSIMWYSRAATQEEHQSELALSGWYLTGSEGILGQSDTEAYLWARKAAMAGLAKAEFAIGYFTEVGIGVPANLEDAKRWYWRAAAQDFPKARERLEDLKRSGKNGPRARERISRSKIGKEQEGECSVM